MRSFLRSFVVIGAFAGLATGCVSKADQAALDGLDAFKKCDLRSASESFASAHSLNTSRSDYALAYALSTVAILPEDPAVTSVVERLGFTDAIDTSMLWGPGGVLDQLNNHASCDAISNFVRDHIPYAPVKENGPSAASVLKDSTLDGNDLADAAVALDPRLESVVNALEQAAGAQPDVDVEGGCGVGKVHIQAPELYALASALEALRAAIQVASGYDWGVPASIILDTSANDKAYVDEVNAHFFHVTDGTKVERGKALMVHSLELLLSGLKAAEAIKSRQENSLFDWSKMPAGVYGDLTTLVDQTHSMLLTSGMSTVPFTEPTLKADLASFFDSPIDYTNATPPLLSIVTVQQGDGSTYDDIKTSSEVFIKELDTRFSPNPAASGAPAFTITKSVSDRWSNITSDAWRAVFDPDKRWDSAYSCTN